MKTARTLNLELSQVARTKSIYNADQAQKVFSATPTDYTYKRPAKGGGQWTYVQVGYVRKALDGLFGFNWDFTVETSLAEAFQVAQKTKVCIVKGSITGRVQVDGEWVAVTKTQFGRADIKFKTEVAKSEDGNIIYENRGGKRQPKKVPTNEPLDFGNDMKAATTDCLKKCAAQFGIASDIYEQDDFTDTIIEGSERHQRTSQHKEETRIREWIENSDTPEKLAEANEAVYKLGEGHELIELYEQKLAGFDIDVTENEQP